ncbi:Peptidyl-prolyl cis-trans isomerase A precursor [Gimesia panareensis]|uniref:Peptidyl-prolyl cis-trans isomerase n=1 Tax=Gimesia panareensis TaxID=2527978 RepID=A0A517Q0Q7_9PLAN|nr:peptidylprolyl isomerase [Gimesia panareensis]QDT25182.1 Peptidyl-prolyl cis-trans isomerase A precursor [Gimesia panareensis]
MLRFTLLALCLAIPCLVGCTSETPTAGDAEIPEAAGGPKSAATDAEDYQVLLKTTKGDILLEVHPEWSPRGAERFKELVKEGFYNDVAFFRVIDGFMAQVGINGDPAVHAKWKDNNIMDDPVVESNKRGYVSFAKTGLPNSRSTQFFINFGDNSNLDQMGFSPFAQVVKGMDVVDSLYKEYGEGAPQGRGPFQGGIVEQGNAYLKKEFPMLDYIKEATIVGEEPAEKEAKPEAEKSEEKAGEKEPVEKQPETKDAEKPEKEAAAKPEKEAAAKEKE